MSSPVAWLTGAHAELHLAAVVEAQHLDLHLVADLDDIGRLADAVRRQLADVDEPVARAKEIDEGAEIDRFHHLAGEDHAELGLGDDAADPVDRGLRHRGVDRRDLDCAVVLDVDLGAGHLADLADHLAAGADHFADLVLRDVDYGDARRIPGRPPRARPRAPSPSGRGCACARPWPAPARCA